MMHMKHPERLQKEIGYLLIFLGVFGGVLGYFTVLQYTVDTLKITGDVFESLRIESSVPDGGPEGMSDAGKIQLYSWYNSIFQVQGIFFLGRLIVAGVASIVFLMGVMMVIQSLESEKELSLLGKRSRVKEEVREHLSFWKVVAASFLLCSIGSLAYFSIVPKYDDMGDGSSIEPFTLKFGFPVPYMEFENAFYLTEYPAILVNMILAFLLSVVITALFWKFVKKKSLREVVVKINLTDISNKTVNRRRLLAISSIATALVFLIMGCMLVLRIDSLHLNDPYLDSTSALWLVWGNIYAVIISMVAGLLTAGMVYVISDFLASGKEKVVPIISASAIVLIFPLMGFGAATYLYSQVIDFDNKQANMPGIKTDYTYGKLDSISEYKSQNRYDPKNSVSFPIAMESVPVSVSMDEYSIVYDPFYIYDNVRQINVVDQRGENFIYFRLRSQYPDMKSFSYASFSEEERYFAFLVDFESDQGQRMLLIFNRAGVLDYEEVFYEERKE